MTVTDLMPFFDERYKEVMAYVDLLVELERVTQTGPPRFEGSSLPISTSQQKILYSSVYLQLYNLVEATVSRCIEVTTEAAEDSNRWLPQQLNDNLHREWVRSTARTHEDLAPENRLKHALEMSQAIAQQLPINNFSIEAGGGGNWDDESIYEMGKRLGCALNLTAATKRSAKQSIRDNVGPLKLVKLRRNGLAHGSLSFVDCADGVFAAELRLTAESVGKYLREVVQCFIDYVQAYEFLHPNSKPKGKP